MKRKRKTTRDSRADKRQKIDTSRNSHPTWPLLRCYYPKVLTLREYLIAKLDGSKKRQRRLLHYGLEGHESLTKPSDAAVVALLDNTVVGTADDVTQTINPQALEKDILLFTQQLTECPATATITPTQGAFKQSEIVDFVIWRVFRRHGTAYGNPTHLLARGYQKYVSGLLIAPGLPGLCLSHRNSHVEVLKMQPWTALPALLGKKSDGIVSDLLLQCGVFRQIEGGSNLEQLSGIPMGDLKQLKLQAALTVKPDGPHQNAAATTKVQSKHRGLSDIRFLRHKIFYAKPAINSKGDVRFGLGHVHVLNRYADADDPLQTIHVMKYIFPRQFGLHNVFTSDTDRNETTQKFKDYTLRESEILQFGQRWQRRKALGNNAQAVPATERPPLPTRLRGEIVELVKRIRKRHSRCAYKSLLEHYCPKSSGDSSDDCTEHASSNAQVSALCRAVVSKLFPRSLWGHGETGRHNERRILAIVDRFIHLRKSESLTMHDVLQDIKVAEIEWLAPASLISASTPGSVPLSKTDHLTRRSILAELLYYLFDSFLIPLIRGAFYVTESNGNRLRLFYFRHDVWRAISAPAFQTLKTTMLEPCFGTSKIGEAKVRTKKATAARSTLGSSTVRLLPKTHGGMRPIMNLRRRVAQNGGQKGFLNKSTNSLLTPAFSILNYEKGRSDVADLGAAMFSVDEIFPRLRAFRAALGEQRLLLGDEKKPLYFAKVDVRACFDTIPQARLLELVGRIVQAEEYRISKYSRAKLIGGKGTANGTSTGRTPSFGARPSLKWLHKASPTTSADCDLTDAINADISEGQRSRTVYVDGAVQKPVQRKAMLELLNEHIGSNMIQIDNRLYRQRHGIPQGSVLSSLLCNYFYAEMEKTVLGFLRDGGKSVLLLRLIDDFLVITTERCVAERFMKVMHAGVPEFGVEVKRQKSRVNFEMEIDGEVVERLSPEETWFPYCGRAIDTGTLDLSKDKERTVKKDVPDMKIEYSKAPGEEFYRKMQYFLKQELKAMLLDTSYNRLATVRSNLGECFSSVAGKMHHYIRALPRAKQPGGGLVIRTVDDLIKLACVLMKNMKKRHGRDGAAYECCISRMQTRRLACVAFADVFRRRQTGHEQLLEWLQGQLMTVQ